MRSPCKRATLAGIVGQDEGARHVRELLQEGGIHEHLIGDPHHPTTLKMRVLGRQQQLLRIDFEEKPGTALVDALHAEVEPLLASHDVMVLSDYAKGALIHVDALDRDGAQTRHSGACGILRKSLRPLSGRIDRHAESQRDAAGRGSLELRRRFMARA